MPAKKRTDVAVPPPLPKTPARKKKVANISEADAMDNALDSMMSNLEELTISKNKTPLHFMRLSDVRTEFLDFDNLYLENLWGCRGLPKHTIGEIIGTEGVGKTTLALWLAGRGRRSNMPVLYVNTEEKPMLVERMARNFSSDRSLAYDMVDRVSYCECHELGQSVTHIEEWAKNIREVSCLPMSIPLMVIIDTWGKMMSAAEAAGYCDEIPGYDTPEVKRKLKDVNTASNLGHANFAHAWVRRLPYFLRHRNVIIILVQHQNVKIDMTGMAGPMIANGQLFNKTKLGGKAFDQLAAWQLIMGMGQSWKTSDGELLGHDVIVRMDKNSYGGRGRRAIWKLRDEKLLDTETYLAPSLHFELDAARWLLDTKLMGATYSQGRYSCASMNMASATPAEFWQAAISDQARVNALAQALKIVGYSNDVDKIIEASGQV